MRDSAEHFERNVRFAPDEIVKILAGEDREPCVFDHMRVGRARLTIQDCHLAEKVAVSKLR